MSMQFHSRVRPSLIISRFITPRFWWHKRSSLPGSWKMKNISPFFVSCDWPDVFLHWKINCVENSCFEFILWLIYFAVCAKRCLQLPAHPNLMAWFTWSRRWRGWWWGPLEWAGHGGEWAPQGQKQSGELGWKRTNEFFRCLPALDWWHHLTVLSITLLPPLPWPIFSPSLLSFPPTFTADRKKKTWRKNCLFLNRPLNLFGLGVIGHLHGKHSEVSAITTGLWHPPRNMLSFR